MQKKKEKKEKKEKHKEKKEVVRNKDLSRLLKTKSTLIKKDQKTKKDFQMENSKDILDGSQILIIIRN